MKEIVINIETPELENCINLSGGICKLSLSVNLILLELQQIPLKIEWHIWWKTKVHILVKELCSISASRF